MSRSILRRWEPESFKTSPLPLRLSEQDLRRRLARFGRPVTTRLRPGERMIDGCVHYSAAWLGPALVRAEDGEQDLKGGDDGRDDQDHDRDGR